MTYKGIRCIHINYSLLIIIMWIVIINGVNWQHSCNYNSSNLGTLLPLQSHSFNPQNHSAQPLGDHKISHDCSQKTINLHQFASTDNVTLSFITISATLPTYYSKTHNLCRSTALYSTQNYVTWSMLIITTQTVLCRCT